MITYIRIINAAIRRYHIEKPIRAQFANSRTQAKLPFGAMLRRLVKDGKITKMERKRLIKLYGSYSKTLHQPCRVGAQRTQA